MSASIYAEIGYIRLSSTDISSPGDCINASYGRTKPALRQCVWLDSAFAPSPASGNEFPAFEETDMPKLRHIAQTVPDLEEAARFYVKNIGLTLASESNIAILLYDGLVSLAV